MTVIPSSSGSSSSGRLLNPEDNGTTLVQNVGKHYPDTASYPRRLQLSALYFSFIFHQTKTPQDTFMLT